MKKLLTVLLLSAFSYSFSSVAKDVEKNSCDPCALYSQDDCATQENCAWNEDYQSCSYNYTGDVGADEDTGAGNGVVTGKDSKVGAKYWGRPWGRPWGGNWGRPWGGNWGRPWVNPWGGPFTRPWYNHVHNAFCIH